MSCRIAALLLFGAATYAQVDTGAMSGVVSDATGAVIPGAKVVITQAETNLQTALTTNASGFYAAPALRPGNYRITASAEGFRTEIRAGIELRVQERLEISFELQLGATSSEITVTASAPLLENETSSLGQVVQEKTITDLPLNGRNFIQLAILGAGTLPSTRTPERDNFIANGARAIQNSYLLDGVENKNRILGFDKSSAQIVQPVLDAIQEFKVQTSTFSAEFGQAAGGVVNVTMKSGGNDIHGSLFEFLRNSRFDARPYFQPAGGGAPLFIQNQFGATLGGPVRRNRVFYFGSWQSSRELNAAPQIGSVPTAAMLQGDFGASRLFDPATTRANPSGSGSVRDPFANNQVPRARWDPVATKLAALFPAPNLPGIVRNHFYNPKERVYNDQYNVRADYRIADRDMLFGRYSGSRNTNTLPTTLPPPANDFSLAEPTSQSAAVSETHTISNTTVNEFRFGFIRTRIQQNISTPRRYAEFGIKGTQEDPNIRGLPQFAISGLSTLGTAGPGTLPISATGSGNLPIDKIGRIYQFLDNVSWVRSRHTIKFGADIQQVSMFGFVTNAARGTFNFNGVYTQNPQARSGTGHAVADFLLGDTNSATVATRNISNIRQRIFQGYIQDDWKVSNRLTLNFGLRYELPKPFIETEDRQANFVIEPGPYFGQSLMASDPKDSGLGRALTRADFNNIAPRFGFAYEVMAKTVLRGGAGVFYGRDENIGVGRRLTQNPPFFIQKQFIADQLVPYVVLATGFPATALDPALVTNPEMNSYPSSFAMPYVLQWNFNVQRELPGQVLLQAGYTGSGAHKLVFSINQNQPPPGTGNVDARRPIRGVGGVFVYAPYYNSSYHALLVKAERRFARGYSFLASYTYGHSIDGGGNFNDSSDPSPQNPRNIQANKGNSNFDVKRRLVVSHVFEFPFGKGKPLLTSGAGALIAGGWQLSGITSMQTGQPFTATLNFDPTNTGTTARPNRIRDGNLPGGQRGPDRWFDIAAFEAPPSLSFGNSGRGILRGPGRINLDLSLARNFRLSERFRLQFRGEMFNLANTPQFGLPGFSIGTAAAGVISTVTAPERQAQLAVRVNW